MIGKFTGESVPAVGFPSGLNAFAQFCRKRALCRRGAKGSFWSITRPTILPRLRIRRGNFRRWGCMLRCSSVPKARQADGRADCGQRVQLYVFVWRKRCAETIINVIVLRSDVVSVMSAGNKKGSSRRRTFLFSVFVQLPARHRPKRRSRRGRRQRFRGTVEPCRMVMRRRRRTVAQKRNAHTRI